MSAPAMDSEYRATRQRWRFSKICPWLSACFVLIGAARIVSTYMVFSATFDEPLHIAAGMEWLSRGVFHYEPKHPPLGRVAEAFPLWVRGIRTIGLPDPTVEGTNLLNSGGKTQENLAWARSGVLIFFVLGSIAVYLWAKRIAGPWCALAALFQFTMLPTIVGLSGLATTDMPGTATLALALFALTAWVASPDRFHGILAGVCVAVAVVSKLLNPPFLLACAAMWVIVHVARSGSLRAIPFPRKGALAAVFACAFVVMAVYRFQWEPASQAKSVRDFQNKLGNGTPLRHFVNRALDWPLPYGNLMRGVGEALGNERDEWPFYFLGKLHKGGGTWLFFPVDVGVKTPIGFLVLAVTGSVMAALAVLRKSAWQTGYPAMFALAILLFCLPVRMNLGVRYVLAIYPLLAVCAGLAAVRLWNAGRFRLELRALLLLLLIWQGYSSAATHPDYLWYFNELAGSHPEWIVADCDLDWGQDLPRLGAALAQQRATHVWLSYYGTADVRQYGMPPSDPLPATPVTGWVAVSVRNLDFFPGTYAWLSNHPSRLIGKSIRLYWVQ
jgi:hypothetical protein